MHPSEAEALIEAWRTKQEREDQRTALVCYVSAVSQGAKKKGGGRLTPADFMPRQPAGKSDEEKLKAKLMGLAKATGTYHGKK